MLEDSDLELPIFHIVGDGVDGANHTKVPIVGNTTSSCSTYNT